MCRRSPQEIWEAKEGHGHPGEASGGRPEQLKEKRAQLLLSQDEFNACCLQVENDLRVPSLPGSAADRNLNARCAGRGQQRCETRDLGTPAAHRRRHQAVRGAPRGLPRRAPDHRPGRRRHHPGPTGADAAAAAPTRWAACSSCSPAPETAGRPCSAPSSSCWRPRSPTGPCCSSCRRRDRRASGVPALVLSSLHVDAFLPYLLWRFVGEFPTPRPVLPGAARPPRRAPPSRWPRASSCSASSSGSCSPT